MKLQTGLLATFALLAGVGVLGMAPANAATSGVASTPAATPGPQHWMRHSRMSAHEIAVVQEALDSTGANLKIDGAWGPATEAALENYQRQAGLAVTGHLNHATWRRLDPIG